MIAGMSWLTRAPFGTGKRLELLRKLSTLPMRLHLRNDRGERVPSMG
jgi:hypothetical protein